MRMNDRRFGPDSAPGLTGGVNVGMRPGMPVRRPLPIMGPDGAGVSRPMPVGGKPRSMNPMAAEQIMQNGRAYAKGGMVGCDWKPKSSATMRGAARKGK